METKTCLKCGSTMFHNKGISQKTGEPYENYKCRCGEIEWVRTPKQGGFQKAVPAQKRDAIVILEEILAELVIIKGILEEIKTNTGVNKIPVKQGTSE